MNILRQAQEERYGVNFVRGESFDKLRTNGKILITFVVAK